MRVCIATINFIQIELLQGEIKYLKVKNKIRYKIEKEKINQKSTYFGIAKTKKK